MKIYHLAKKSSMEILKENKIPLNNDERNTCLKAKAVWHHGPNGEESPAVWKSKNSKGEIIYVTNTHRAYQTDPTLDGCIKKFHDVIKDTASVQDFLIRTAQYESYEDVLYSVDDAREDLMREFYNKRRKKGSMMSWSVIPFARLKKIWDDYAKYGVVRDEQGINEISNHMLKNLARLQAATELGGHSQLNTDEWAKEMGFKPIGGRNDDFYGSFLETQYGTPISDYGLPQLWELANNLLSASSSESKLVILDQMLNVCHQRGDLAALFIEGGKGSLDQLFLGNTEEEKIEVANVHGWYKAGKEFLKTAVADGEFRDLKDRVTSIKDDIRGLKKDDKDIESRVKKLEKTIDDLNIGSRRFFQQQDTFNSLQRKIERVDTVMQEWNNYKKEMDDNIRKQVEKHTKARIGDITPKAY
jgi:hypothetical protein